MKQTVDLLAAVSRMRDQYRGGKVDRDILRKWITGLGSYPAPHGPPVDAAKAWFAQPLAEVTEAVRDLDIEHLSAIVLTPPTNER
jgi:hypothetical protein